MENGEKIDLKTQEEEIEEPLMVYSLPVKFPGHSSENMTFLTLEFSKIY